MTASIYAVILALLICQLALKVIAARRHNKVVYADGGVSELQVVRSAHANATEYIPIALLLLFALEFNGGHLLLVHILGITFVAARIIHSRGILAENLKGRIRGMKLTFFSIIALCISNVLYFPFDRILHNLG
jgi:uncharacterized membrane protein YecN with MAPEG domain